MFPWAAFAFAGMGFGFLIFSPWARDHLTAAFALGGLAGGLLFWLGLWLDGRRTQLYAVHDFWHTSPNFFLARLGVLLGICLAIYAWCRWGAALKGFSPVMELGRTSLFVYWLHIEFVYGRFSILPKHSQSIFSATLGVLAISAAMVVVAVIRNHLKGKGLGALAFWRRPERVAA
jgi:fucose 4-O-acetylase-like acetyltransferase